MGQPTVERLGKRESLSAEKLAVVLRRLAEQYAALARQVLGENLTSVVLFGSVARGQVRPDSDIDLLLIARQLPRGAFRRRELLDPIRDQLLGDLENLWARGVYTDFVELLRTEEEARHFHLLYLDMTQEASLLYDRDGFFAAVLERTRRQLQALGAQRRRMGKMRYWDLKPDFQPGEVIHLE